MTAALTDRERWNERHAATIAAGQGDRPPADWVDAHRDVLAGRAPGRALDVGCGRGRNALVLAELGFQVDALDVSDVAIAHLEERARRRDLTVAARVADLKAEPLPPGPYDVVVNTFFLERRLFGPMRAALGPAGLLVVVAFLDDGRPGHPSRRLAPGELRSAFAGLTVLDYHEGPPDPGSRPRASLLAAAGEPAEPHLDSEAP